MPMARAGAYYVNIKHIGGPGYLLYVLPLGAGALAVLSLYREVRYLNLWFILLGLGGLALAMVAGSAATEYVEYFARRFGHLASLMGQSSPSPGEAGYGAGAVLCILSYVGLLAAALWAEFSSRR